MYTGAVDQNVDLAPHGVQGFLKETLYGIQIAQVAVNVFGSDTHGPNGADGVEVRLSAFCWSTEYKADGGACLSQGLGTSGPDASSRGQPSRKNAARGDID